LKLCVFDTVQEISSSQLAFDTAKKKKKKKKSTPPELVLFKTEKAEPEAKPEIKTGNPNRNSIRNAC